MMISLNRILLLSAFSPCFASAATLSFGPAGSSQSIPGSAITYTTSTIEGGTSPASNHLGSGTISNTTIGGSYGGTFFSALADSDNTLTTRIGSNNRELIDNGVANQYGNYVGLHVQFSAPIPMYGFGFLDLDGGEWVGSFAYQSGTMVTTAPSITRGSTTDMSLPNATVDWSGLTGAPTTTTPVVRDLVGGNKDPDDANGQVLFDYSGTLVTDLYFLFGVAANTNGTSVNNSGVTGFSVIDPAVTVPEPTSTALLLSALVAFGLLRRRS